MSALVAFCIWVLIASAIGFAPRRFHWPGAIFLLATAGPMLWWLYASYGPWWMLAALAAMLSILRWPALFLLKRLATGLGLRSE